MFTPSNMLQKYLNVRPRDIYDITGALMGYINVDPGFKTNDFEEAVKYVLTHGVSEEELYKEYDPGRNLEEDESKWDDEYYSYARVYLKDNFCRKRIEHVKKVAGKLYPVMSSDTSTAKKPDREQAGSEQEKPAQTKERLQETGKKAQGQTDQNQIITGPVFVKIAVGLVIIFAVLALLIVFITGWGENHLVEEKSDIVFCRMIKTESEMTRQRKL